MLVSCWVLSVWALAPLSGIFRGSCALMCRLDKVIKFSAPRVSSWMAHGCRLDCEDVETGDRRVE